MYNRYWIGSLSIALFVWSLVLTPPVSILAQESPEGSMGMHGKMGKEKGPGKMDKRGDMHKRHAHMKAMHTEQLQELQQQLSALRAHTTTLDSITDQQQLLTELKKHQHMTDTLLDTMVEQRKKMHLHMQARHKRMQSHRGKRRQTEEDASAGHEAHHEGE